MRPLFEKIKDEVEVFDKKSSHFSPHVHSFLEIILVTRGTLEIGVEKELYHMETGDLAIIFPGLVHHAQVFGGGVNRSIHLLAALSYCGSFQQEMTGRMPETPVIEAARVHPDVPYSLNRLLDNVRGAKNHILDQAFIQIILARCIPQMSLVERSGAEDGDLVYRTVAYVGAHALEPMTLTSLAKGLNASPYALSRIFSGVFHMKFNEYLNTHRLDYALNLLRFTDQNITEVWINAGFESQRTFNRVFKEKYHMTPREFRLQDKENERLEEQGEPKDSRAN